MSANSSRSAAARRMTLMSNAPRIALGQLVATPGAMELLEQTGFSALALISRHVHGDWGDCCDEDKATKEILQNPERSLLEARKSWHPPRHEAKQP